MLKVEETLKIKQKKDSPLWLLIKDGFGNMHPGKLKEIKLEHYGASVALNSLSMYLVYSKFHIWWNTAVTVGFIFTGYFFQKAFIQRFKGEKKEAVKSAVVDNQPKDINQELHKTLIKFNLKPQFIEYTTDDFAKHYTYRLDYLKSKLTGLRVDIEAESKLLENSLSLSFHRNLTKFSIAHEEKKKFLLDDVLATITEDDIKGMRVPFLLGISKKTGKPKYADLTKIYHLLIAGTTGSGKSTTLNALLKALMYLNPHVSYYMTDFKNTELPKYKKWGLNNIKYFERDYDGTLQMFQMVEQEYNRRLKLLNENDCVDIFEYNKRFPENTLSFLIVVTDEANGYKDFKPDECDVLEDLRFKMIRLVRACGISFIEAVQRIIDTKYSKSIRSMMAGRYVMKVERSDIPNVIDGDEWRDKAKLLTLGDFIWHLNDAEHEEFRSPFTHNDDKISNWIKEVYGNGIKITIDKEQL
jgi:energy-coupling factor transporter ATP-binding protein EcfA2